MQWGIIKRGRLARGALHNALPHHLHLPPSSPLSPTLPFLTMPAASLNASSTDFGHPCHRNPTPAHTPTALHQVSTRACGWYAAALAPVPHGRRPSCGTGGRRRDSCAAAPPTPRAATTMRSKPWWPTWTRGSRVRAWHASVKHVPSGACSAVPYCVFREGPYSV